MDHREALSSEEIDGILGNHKICLEEYAKPYIHRNIVPITEDVYIVHKGDDIYNDLINKCARGVCPVENGHIYFRYDVEITAHLLIHEFIHRLSRNRKFIMASFSWCWVEGIDFPSDYLTYINEAITEMIAVDIMGEWEENNPYNKGLKVIDMLCNKIDKTAIIYAYMSGNRKFFKNILKKDYKSFKDNFLFMMTYSQSDEYVYQLMARESEKELMNIINRLP